MDQEKTEVQNDNVEKNNGCDLGNCNSDSTNTLSGAICILVKTAFTSLGRQTGTCYAGHR